MALIRDSLTGKMELPHGLFSFSIIRDLWLTRLAHVCNLASYFTERHREATYLGVSASSALSPWEMRHPRHRASPGRLSLGLGEMSHLETSPSGSSESSTFSGWRLFLLEILWLLLREKQGGQAPHILPKVTSAPSFLTSLPENSHGGLGGQQGLQSDLTGRPVSRASPGADSGTPGPIPVELLTPLAREQGCVAPPFTPLSCQSSVLETGSLVCPS